MRRTVLSTALSAALLTSLALAATPALAATSSPTGTSAHPTAVSALASASSASSASSAPTLKAGSKGAAVVRVQKALGVKQTGVFDSATVAAVKAFQRANHLAVTGVVTSSTWGAVVRVEKAVATARASFASQRSAANTAIARERSSVLVEARSIAHRPAEDTTLLLHRLDSMRRTLDVAAAAVAKAGTVAQVRAQAAWPAKVRVGVDVVDAQSASMQVTRKDVFAASMSGYLDYVLTTKPHGRTVAADAERAARAKVLAAGEVYRLSVAPAAVALRNTDPLSAAAKGRADAVIRAFSTAWTTPSGKAYDAALGAYYELVLG